MIHKTENYLVPVDMNRLPMWTIYDHPDDFEDNYVARLVYSAPRLEATDLVVVASSLKELRKFCAETSSYCLPRSPGDDAYIVESWML
jgi:hypothetical protein